MKKQELVHLHSLLAEVARYCQAEGVALDLSTYHEQDTHPMAISDAKDDHEAAVLALADGITTGMRDETSGDEKTTRATAG